MMKLLDQILDSAKAQGITQKELASKVGISEESLSRLKSRDSLKTRSLELLAEATGFELVLQPKAKPPPVATAPFREKYKYLAWSNPKASPEVLLRQALLQPDFSILLDAAVEFGVPALQEQWQELQARPDQAVQRAAPITSRMLSHIVAANSDN